MGFNSTFMLVAFVALLSAVNAISSISAVGSKFFTSDGAQWFVKGVAYQLTEDDPLTDTNQCTLDAALMKQLGANSIRVYHVDATADHTGCMNAFAAAGIYVFVDLDSFKTYIRYDSTPAWTQNKSDAYHAVMDAFHTYDNTAGFFVGNEVLNSLNDSGSAPYVLAAAADMKTYRSAKGYRNIPVGYSATDTGALPMLQDYLVCRPNATERLDFYALNSYRWCGSDATYQTSGYVNLQAAAEGYPVPIFFSETGCNTVPPRTFGDQAAIFGSNMDNTWSGAIIYEWIQELNAYGLISYGPQLASDVVIGTSVIQGFTRQGTPTPVQPDFSNLQAQWATLKPTGVSSQQYVASMSSKSRTCPAFTASGWTVDPSAALPTLNQAAVSGSGASTATGTTKTTSSSGASSAHSSAASASASKAAGVKSVAHPFSTSTLDMGIMGVSASLAVMVAAVMCWL